MGAALQKTGRQRKWSMFNMLLISIHIVPDIGVSMLCCVSANPVVEYSKFCARARLIAGTFNMQSDNKLNREWGNLQGVYAALKAKMDHT